MRQDRVIEARHGCAGRAYRGASSRTRTVRAWGASARTASITPGASRRRRRHLDL